MIGRRILRVVGVDMQPSEHACEPLVIFRRQVLIAKNQHVMGIEGGADVVELLRRKRLREIGAVYLRADDGSYRVDAYCARAALVADAHGRFSRRAAAPRAYPIQSRRQTQYTKSLRADMLRALE
jgi:hypothetical protein